MWMVKSRIEEREGKGIPRKGKAGMLDHTRKVWAEPMWGRRMKGKVRLASESLLRAEGMQFIV